MRSSLRFVVFFVIAAAAFAQHGRGFGGGFRGGLGTGFRSVNGRFAQPGVARFGADFGGFRGNAGRFGNGFFAPYFPFLDYYASDDLAFGDYPPPSEPMPPITVVVLQPTPTEMAPPPQPAHPVMHEYTWNDEKESEGDSPTYTIALKDGYWRTAVIAWVQDGQLHYIDPQHKHRTLSSDLIDHESTERLNQQKNLHLELPPG